MLVPLPAVYTRCPFCRRVLPAARVTTSRHAVGDWPQEITCSGCLRQHLIGPSDLLTANASVQCAVCRHVTACPAAAERVRCDACGAGLPGPAASDRRR